MLMLLIRLQVTEPFTFPMFPPVAPRVVEELPLALGLLKSASDWNTPVTHTSCPPAGYGAVREPPGCRDGKATANQRRPCDSDNQSMHETLSPPMVCEALYSLRGRG